MTNLEDVRAEAFDKGREFRVKHELGVRGVDNLFNFIEKTLGYLLVRYPFGMNSLQGFASVYNAERLIVTNSSERLSRERFTAVHELGHHLFDIDESDPKLIYDDKTEHFNNDNLVEYRADCFAASFLMPEEGIKKAIKETGKKTKELNYADLIQLQSEFGVSHSSMVKRIFELGLIDRQKSSSLYDYFEQTKTPLKGLFLRYNADTELLEPYNKIQVPAKFLKYIQENYDLSYISYATLKMILVKLDKTPEELGFSRNDDNEEKVFDLDEILGELNE